jgi:hypothetical protein
MAWIKWNGRSINVPILRWMGVACAPLGTPNSDRINDFLDTRGYPGSLTSK